MERTPIGSLRQKIGETVKIQGWLETLRDQKKMQFLILRDRTGTVQVALWRANNPELADQISKLNVESALTLTGKVVDNPVVKLGGLEVQLETLKVENAADAPLPIDPFAADLASQDLRMDWRYLDLRRKENLVIFEIETTVEMAMRRYWVEHGFIEMQSPKIMGTPSESGAELFELIYFDRKAYLSQSPQFFKQMAMAAGWENVFEIGPVFRADPSFTSRHMTEFTGVDMEMAWIDSHEDVMAFMERWLQYIYQQVKDKHDADMKQYFQRDLPVPSLPFPRISMAEALVILKEQGYTPPPEKKGDIDPAGERLLGQYIKEKYGHEFVYLTDWPISVRPFYHMRTPENPNLTRSFDLIATGLEITTGAQREHRYDVLLKQAKEKGLNAEPIQFYLDFFRYGCPPHGGFGLGLARLMMVLLGLPNIREAVYLFRGPNRLSP
jgi:aspartyl-tRNA synthetase